MNGDRLETLLPSVAADAALQFDRALLEMQAARDLTDAEREQLSAAALKYSRSSRQSPLEALTELERAMTQVTTKQQFMNRADRRAAARGRNR